MELHHVYLRFTDGTFGRIPDVDLELASDVYFRYDEDPRGRERERITDCWVMRADNLQLVLGTPPADWTPQSPVRENDTRKRA